VRVCTGTKDYFHVLAHCHILAKGSEEIFLYDQEEIIIAINFFMKL